MSLRWTDDLSKVSPPSSIFLKMHGWIILAPQYINQCIVELLAKNLFYFFLSTFPNPCFLTSTWVKEVKEIGTFTFARVFLYTNIHMFTLAENANTFATPGERSVGSIGAAVRAPRAAPAARLANLLAHNKPSPTAALSVSFTVAARRHCVQHPLRSARKTPLPAECAVVGVSARASPATLILFCL